MSTTSRPMTPAPGSPSSLHNATTTIDDLTIALSSYSRALSPEPHDVCTCCCGKDECESTKAWNAFRTKLESRLVLSAEIGQALLERHEAYVRRHELGQTPYTSPLLSVQSPENKRTEEQVDARVAELVRENAVLEKRLSQALMNNEIADLTHHTTLEALKQAEEKLSHLSAQNARFVGTDSRLATALQEKDDIQQERDSATQRARMAEARVVSLKEKCSKFQAQVGRLREDLDMQRTYRHEMSDEVLSDARTRLHQLQQLNLGHSAMADDSEVSKVLESLVADNEALKHDNAELQNLLAETREDLRAVQEEVEERRASDTPYHRHRFNESGGSSAYHDHSPISSTFNFGTAPTSSTMHSVFGRSKAGPSSDRRALSAERGTGRGIEPLTPETTRRSFSPADSAMPSGSKLASTSQSRSRYAHSHLSLELDEHDSESERPRAQKPLLLLTRSRAVQTDDTGSTNNLLAPSPIPRSFGDHMSSHDGQSDSSSLIDSNPSVVGVIVERVALLLNRLVQADALTLTNRLKRQRLLGADVSHLSRNTVTGILNDSNTLRVQFRSFLEDEKVVTTCTRRDLRALFKLFKDMFTEMGQLRVTLNDVILDPTVAGKVSDMAMHPSKANPAAGEQSSATTSSGPGWIAPISKFLGLPTSSGKDEAATRALSPPARTNSQVRDRPPPRIVPKREAALSASAMTVNVEFSGVGVGRAVTSTSAQPGQMVPTSSSSTQISATSGDSAKSLMDIFAGAPRPAEADPWIVVPKPQRGALGGRRFDIAGGATIGRSTMRTASGAVFGNGAGRLSRAVDAVIDQTQHTSPTFTEEERDTVSNTLLERTLRPRGLSDSSIHTTFMNHANEEEPIHSSPDGARPDRQSVLQALTRRVQGFRLGGSSFISPNRPFSAAAPPSGPSEGSSSISRPHTPTNRNAASPPSTANVPIRRPTARAISPAGGSLFQSLNISSWAASALPSDPPELDSEDDEPHPAPGFHPSRVREEAVLNRDWVRGREV